MKVVFNDKFFNSEYVDDQASKSGRLESIMDAVKAESGYQIIKNESADYEDIRLVHDVDYIDSIKQNKELYNMALLSTGGAIKSSQIAMESNPAFACIRPPGHHASISSGWGYCHFSNMAIALKKLKHEGLIKSAFVLDFDAHTGDGTIDSLCDWKEVKILNPMGHDSDEYIKLIESYIKEIEHVDIIAVCAGFDSYIKDYGKKLNTFDFYRIGYILKQFSRKLRHNRRFAILEGGYYHPDLGKNVVSFCEGFK